MVASSAGQQSKCTAPQCLVPCQNAPHLRCAACAPSKHSQWCVCTSFGTQWRSGRSRHLHHKVCQASREPGVWQGSCMRRPFDGPHTLWFSHAASMCPVVLHALRLSAPWFCTLCPASRTRGRQVARHRAAHARGGVVPRQIVVVAGTSGAAVVKLRAPARGGGPCAAARDGTCCFHLQGWQNQCWLGCPSGASHRRAMPAAGAAAAHASQRISSSACCARNEQTHLHDTHIYGVVLVWAKLACTQPRTRHTPLVSGEAPDGSRAGP